MTHLTSDIERICRLWCPIIDECPRDHYCEYMKEIKKNIVNIAQLDNFKDYE